MYHFPSPKHPSMKSRSTVDDGKPRLPTELLLHIASYIDDTRHLARLCVASRTFHAIFLPTLYKTVFIDTRGLPPNTKIRRQLAYFCLPHLAPLITTLNVTLSRGTLCIRRSRTSIWGKPAECTCDTYEGDLVKTLEWLSNLRALHVVCRLCVNREPGQYLHDHSLLKKHAPSSGFTLNCVQLANGRRFPLTSASGTRIR